MPIEGGYSPETLQTCLPGTFHIRMTRSLLLILRKVQASRKKPLSQGGIKHWGCMALPVLFLLSRVSWVPHLPEIQSRKDISSGKGTPGWPELPVIMLIIPGDLTGNLPAIGLILFIAVPPQYHTDHRVRSPVALPSPDSSGRYWLSVQPLSLYY